MTIIKIQFGTGGKYINEYINTDITDKQKIDKIVDLEDCPYDFKDNYADEILCNHTLEHIPNPTKAMKEFHRIIKPTGIVKIQTPHFSAAYSLNADIHIRTFGTLYFYWFINGNLKYNEGEWDSGYYDKVWYRVTAKIIFPRGFLSIIYKPIEMLVNINRKTQFLYETLFSGIIRANELHVKLYNKVI